MRFKFKFLSIFLVLTMFSITGALSQSTASQPQVQNSANAMGPNFNVTNIKSGCVRNQASSRFYRVLQVTLDPQATSYYGSRGFRCWYKKTNVSNWSYVVLRGTSNPYNIALPAPGNYQIVITTDDGTTPFQTSGRSAVFPFTLPTTQCDIP